MFQTIENNNNRMNETIQQLKKYIQNILIMGNDINF
jgi:hypothetical protein